MLVVRGSWRGAVPSQPRAASAAGKAAIVIAIASGCGGSGNAASTSSNDSSTFRDAAGGEERTTNDGNNGPVLTGTVVSWYTQRPLAQRKVSIGDQSTTTDDQGQFTFYGVSGSYDVFIAEPDGSAVTLYRGLARRDPLLVHPGAPTLSHSASVSGDLSGGAEYPLAGSDIVTVDFFSTQADQFMTLGGGQSTLQGGPAYGPIPLQWDGPASISGRLVGLGTFQNADGSRSSWFVDRATSIADGQSLFANLVLGSVPRTARLSATVELPETSALVQKEVFYRWPLAHAVLGIPVSASPSFDEQVPDIGEPDVQLCAGVIASPGSSLTERCGLSLPSNDLVLTVQAPPILAYPTDGAKVTRDMSLLWSRFDNGVYLLKLDADPSTPTSPRIFLFTSETTTAWPDLSAIGLGFPSAAAYQCSIGGLGPYASMDEAAGPGGLGSMLPTEIRRSFSPVINVKTSP